MASCSSNHLLSVVVRMHAHALSNRLPNRGLPITTTSILSSTNQPTGIRVAATGGDKDEEIRRAAGNWVEGAKATSIRFVLPQDEPDRLTLVPVAATEEGVDEGYEYDFGTGPTAATAAVAEPAVVKKGKVVVSSVVAAAPAMRRKRPAAAAVEDGGGGKNGAGSDVGGKRQNP